MFETILTDDKGKIAIERKIEITEHTTRGEIISLFFEGTQRIYGLNTARY